MRIAACLIAGLLTTGAAQAQRCASPLPPQAGVPPLSMSPVVIRVLGGPVTPVPATDDLIHLAYAAHVTNIGAVPAELRGIIPFDPLRSPSTGGNEVSDVDGKPITGKVRLFGPPGEHRDASQLAAGASGITFFDLTYRTLADVPELVGHLVTVRSPAGTDLATRTDPMPVNCDGAVQLSPPLTGNGWWNGNGCCRTVNAHRSATLPLNGDLRVPEQFAIDFTQITPAGGCCTGPVRLLRSWPYYGAPIVAAAAGTVVVATDGLPDQIPGPPEGVTLDNAAGNHVIQDIGGGRWILYAHMRPGTVAVRAGEVLRVGQQIGELGNSGSSTAPHLHFQVMNRPSVLNATGLPFVFGRQQLQGVVLGTAAQAELDYESGRPLRIERRDELRLGEMPAEGHVFGFGPD